LPREATLVGTGFRLQVVADRYEFDDFDNWHDGNWVICRVDAELVSGDHFSGRVGITMLTREPANFATDLRRLVDDASGTADLIHLEGQVGLTVSLDAGKGSIKGFVAKPPVVELEFAENETDLSFLVPAAREFEAVAREFPVRDHPIV